MKTIYSTMHVKVDDKEQTLSAIMAVGFDTQETLASIHRSIAEGLHGHGVSPALLTAKGVRDTEREDGSKDDDFYKGISDEALTRFKNQKVGNTCKVAGRLHSLGLVHGQPHPADRCAKHDVGGVFLQAPHDLTLNVVFRAGVLALQNINVFSAVIKAS